MSKHEIDDATFVRAFGAQPRPGPSLDRWQSWRFAVVTYLAELPEPEPKRNPMVDDSHRRAAAKKIKARAVLAKVRG